VEMHTGEAGISLFRREWDGTVTCCLAGFSLRTWAGLPDDGSPVSTSARGPRTGSRLKGGTVGWRSSNADMQSGDWTITRFLRFWSPVESVMRHSPLLASIWRPNRTTTSLLFSLRTGCKRLIFLAWGARGPEFKSRRPDQRLLYYHVSSFPPDTNFGTIVAKL
jgi:hypothetical protein